MGKNIGGHIGGDTLQSITNNMNQIVAAADKMQAISNKKISLNFNAKAFNKETNEIKQNVSKLYEEFEKIKKTKGKHYEKNTYCYSK